MKRYFWLPAILLLVIIVIVILIKWDRIVIASDATVILNYSNNQTHFSRPVNQKEEKEKIISILNDKKCHNSVFVGELSCGFSENVSITINNEIYEIACDNCPYILVKSTGKYLFLTDEEAKTIRGIFLNYGGIFPCE